MNTNEQPLKQGINPPRNAAGCGIMLLGYHRIRLDEIAGYFEHGCWIRVITKGGSVFEYSYSEDTEGRAIIDQLDIWFMESIVMPIEP